MSLMKGNTQFQNQDGRMKTLKKLREDGNKELRRENSKCRKKLKKIRYLNGV